MKRGAPAIWGAPHGKGLRPRTGGHAGEAVRPGQYAIKSLVSAAEAMVVLGPGGATSKEIGQGTGTKLHLSGRHEFYPGTQLQELTIRGPGVDAVANAMILVLTRIIESCGAISGGDPDVQEGNCRVRVIVPIAAAKAVIGRGGENIKALRAESGLHVHIDEVAIGMGETAEQVIELQGSYMAVQVGLPNVMERVAEFVEAPWFSSWASVSNAGNPHVTAIQMGKGKGKGGGKSAMAPAAALPAKGKGKSKGFGKGKGAGKQAIADFQGWGPSLGPARAQAHEWAEPAWVDAGSPALDMLANALAALPQSAANLRSRGESVSFTCPQECVSAVIGKGGAITKEITAATGVKVMIREIEGNEQEKSVTLVGSAPGVAAAYLLVVARISAVKDTMGKGAFTGGHRRGPKGPAGELDGLESAVANLGQEDGGGDVDFMFDEMISEE